MIGCCWGGGGDKVQDRWIELVRKLVFFSFLSLRSLCELLKKKEISFILNDRLFALGSVKNLVNYSSLQIIPFLRIISRRYRYVRFRTLSSKRLISEILDEEGKISFFLYPRIRTWYIALINIQRRDKLFIPNWLIILVNNRA